MFRYRVVFGLPTKQVKNKLPLLRTQVRRYRSENHPTSEDSGLHSIQDPKQNEKKKKKTLLLWEHLHFISSSKTLMAREELCQLSLALLYSWELPSMGTRFRFFWKRQAEHRARTAQRRTYGQVHPDTSPSSSQLLTDRHRRKTFL